MTLPDKHAGKRYRCPLCLNYFEVPAVASAPAPATTPPVDRPTAATLAAAQANGPVAPPAVPEPPAKAPTETEAQSARRRTRLDWVSLGLVVYEGRLLALLLTVVLYLVLISASMFSWGTVATTWLGETLTWLINMASIPGPLLGVISCGFCLGVPGAARARRFLLVALVLDLANVALRTLLILEYFLQEAILLPFLAEYFPGENPTLLAFRLLVTMSLLLPVAAWVFFLFFLRRLALYFEEDVVAGETAAILRRGLYLFLLPMVVLGFMFELQDVLACLAVPAIIFLSYYGLLALALLIGRQFALIGTLRQLIRSRS